jgi:hypothetical protein
MTYKVTLWDKHQVTGTVRDYRLPIWGGGSPQNTCHGMSRVMTNGIMGRPWFIELEGDVPESIVYKWALMAIHPKAPRENVTVNGEAA